MILLLVLSLIVLKKTMEGSFGALHSIIKTRQIGNFLKSTQSQYTVPTEFKYDVRGFVIPDKIHINIIDT